MADRKVRLYYFPMSAYTQRVRIALREKDVKYESVIVDILSGQQTEAWYLRINSAGQVPTLQDGDKIIKESETILDYIDREFPSDIKLVPDLSTEIGKEVSKWRKILDESTPLFVLTFGTWCYPELSVSGLSALGALRQSRTEIIASLQINSKKMEQLADEHPDVREAYMAKAAVFEKRISMLSKDNVIKALDDLESLMDKVEEQLKKVDADPSKEMWFCGQQFTAADIYLCVVLARLQVLGLGERYHTAEKRPRLHAYWQQAKKRPSVQTYSMNVVREVMRLKMMQKVKTALPILGGLVTVGLAASLAFVFAQKRIGS